MRRPLALFGAAFFLAMLVAVRLPAWLLFVVAAAAVLLCVLAALIVRAGGLPAHITLSLAAVAMAFLLCGVHGTVFIQPMSRLQGKERQVTARVTNVQPGYGGDTVHATLQLLSIEGESLYTMPQVEVRGVNPVDIGARVSTSLEFYTFATTSARTRHYSKGQYIGATATQPLAPAGSAHTFLTQMRALQYAAGSSIMARFPLRLSSLAAAMAVGDRRFVPAETTEAYRMAGLSHVLVVSGLHLSILCTYLYALLRRLLHRRRPAALLCMAFVLLFMAFTGFTPSIVRSGFVYLFMYAAVLFSRRADTLTSMALAAIILLAGNPYACYDVGLLLSFTATFGALAGARLALKWRSRAQAARAAQAATASAPAPFQAAVQRAAHRLAEAALTPICVTLATLPVLIAAGLGFSLLSLPMNIIAVPLLAPIVLCSLLLALPAVPVLGWLAAPASLISGGLLSLLEWLTGLCARASWAWVPVGGSFGLVAVLAVYALFGAALWFRRPLPYVPAALALVLVSLALSGLLSAGTVQVHVATGGQNTSLVVTSGGQSVVLYRGRQTASAVSRILRQTKSENCVLFVDLRRSSEGTEYEARFAPAQVVIVNEDIISRMVYQPLPSVTVSVARQGKGTAACVDIEGYKIGLTSGTVNLEPYAPLDILLSGSGTVQGQYAILLSTGKLPQWAPKDAKIIQSDGDTLLWVRPGKSVIWKEISDGISNG